MGHEIRTFKTTAKAATRSTDLTRCKQTAEAIGAPLSLQVNFSPQLRERHLGLLQGLTIKEAATQQPLALQCLGGSTSRKIPAESGCVGQGESVDELCSRVSAEIERIAAQHPGQRALLVAHGGVIAAAHRRATGEQAARAHNGCINVLRVQGNKWAVVSWGDISIVGDASGNFGGGEGG
ncbi:histidine phosphatase superfamily [Dunaliella salina]|uniref:Histidine phosphatase superfamily n=1 Tax=Dunaliella salina TaxID=3046 RepID=A0ABQ7H9D3_DUNSA|nr:histidine phosphatase superfamily [Dunaliella salina]|eukprot:KAF5843456.1 histidine phosphatase superfamily [Dunaliella salina]